MWKINITIFSYIFVFLFLLSHSEWNEKESLRIAIYIFFASRRTNRSSHSSCCSRLNVSLKPLNGTVKLNHFNVYFLACSLNIIYFLCAHTTRYLTSGHTRNKTACAQHPSSAVKIKSFFNLFFSSPTNPSSYIQCPLNDLVLFLKAIINWNHLETLRIFA